MELVTFARRRMAHRKKEGRAPLDFLLKIYVFMGLFMHY
jgi:hypothetical protein